MRAIVAKVVEEQLTARLTSTKRGEKSQSALLLEKVVSEMKSRISARLHKETQRRKNALESSTLPTKLRDCRTSDVGRSELFIVEGGAGSGRSFELEAARYGKVIIMTDADVDGAHIRTLLLTLFFRYMRPLVEAGRVYAAMPPLHRLEVINAGSKKNELIYTFNEPEMRRTLARLEKSGKKIKQPMQRYKGLGEMDADQLADTTMDPRHRTLRQVTMRDLETAERVFELLMGNEVAPRKDFIIGSANDIDRERIDA